MRGVVAFFTGLPSSGKSALAEAVGRRLAIEGTPCCVLDGDAVRAVLRPEPGFAEKDRDDFYATLGGLAALLARQGLVVLLAATAHLARHRDFARTTDAGFVEVFVDTPVQECERRDSKGLYAKARKGEIRDFPGVDAEYQRPAAPAVTAPGGLSDAAVAAVCSAISKAREG